jgi:putative FmdB family regulatory protein
MPIYEYQCQQCEHKLQALQKISDDPLKECPECNEAALKKLISAASFRLKGGGWYETDFKTGDKKQLAESDSAAADKSSKDDSKSEPKAKKSTEGESKSAKPAEKPKSKSTENTSSSSKAGKSSESVKSS